MRSLEGRDSALADFFLTKPFLDSPEDQICQWRREAGILHTLGGRRLQKDSGRERARRMRDTMADVGTLDQELDRLGERETRERLALFPYEELEQAGMTKQLALAVVLTIEHWLRVEKYSLGEQVCEELTALPLSAKVVDQVTASLGKFAKERRSRLASTKQAIPIRPGSTPWPAPFVSALVFEAKLERRGQKQPECINKIVVALGGSPDQLDQYRLRLARIQVPPPPFKQAGCPKVSVIEWLAESFEYYPNCWTEQPAQLYYFSGRFFDGLPEEAVKALVRTTAESVQKGMGGS